MTTTDPEQLELLKNHSKREFDRVNPEIWNKVKGNPEKIEQAMAIQDRMSAIKERLHNHCKKHRTNWVAQEVVKIFTERERLNLEHPAPNWAPNPQISYLEEARQRVQNRINTRFKRIPEIGKRLQSNFVNDQVNTNETLKSKVMSIVDRTQEVRDKARIHFARHKDIWIKKAQQRRSQNPQMDVYQKQRERLSRIDKAEHRLIHQAFKEHGRSIAEEKDQTMTQEFNLAM